jgi:hypothetical protein
MDSQSATFFLHVAPRLARAFAILQFPPRTGLNAFPKYPVIH